MKKGKVKMSSEKIVIIVLSVGVIRELALYEMIQYFPKPCQHSSGNINVELDLSDYAT